MPFLSPNQQCQITEGKKYHIPWTYLPQAHLEVFQLCLWPVTTNSSWLSRGRVAMPLISPLMPVPCKTDWLILGFCLTGLTPILAVTKETSGIFKAGLFTCRTSLLLPNQQWWSTEGGDSNAHLSKEDNVSKQLKKRKTCDFSTEFPWSCQMQRVHFCIICRRPLLLYIHSFPSPFICEC